MSKRQRWLARGVALSATALLGSGLLVLTGPAAHANTTVFSNTPLASWRANGVGWAVLTVGNTVYVGGDFTSVTSPDGRTTTSRVRLAAFDVTTGALINTFRADADGSVRALAYDGTRLYVGGYFTHINGVYRGGLAAVDPGTGQVSTTWVANTSSIVYGLAVSSADLYVAGAFSKVGNLTRTHAAAVRLSDATVEPWAPSFDNTTNSVAVTPDGSRVYLGGDFSKVDGQSVTNFVALDASGAVVPRNWYHLGGPVLSSQLSTDGSKIAVSVGGYDNRGEVYDTTTGARQWYQECDGDGQAVRWIGDAVFTGFHEGCNGDTTIRLTLNDATTGVRDTSFIPSFDKFWGVRGLGGNSAYLVAAGDFTKVSGVSVQGFVIFPARGSVADTSPPTAPTGLTATAASSTQIRLAWSAATDNVGVTGYRIFRGGTAIGTVGGTTLGYTDTALTPQTTYSYAVQAFDAAGNNGPLSATASATTPAQSTVEYVGNPSVETDLSGWGDVWNPTYTTVSRTSAEAFAGTYSVRVDTASTGGTSAGFGDSPRWLSSTVAGTTYRASAWVKSNVANTKVCLRQTEYSGSWTNVGETETCLTLPDTNWHQVVNTYTPATAGHSIQINIYASYIQAGTYFLADSFSETAVQ